MANHKKFQTALSQAIAIQSVLFRDIQDPLTKRSVRAALARAWCDVEERKRIIRGIPLPGSLPAGDALRALKRARAKALPFAEPIEAPIVPSIDAPSKASDGEQQRTNEPEPTANEPSKESLSGEEG